VLSVSGIHTDGAVRNWGWGGSIFWHGDTLGHSLVCTLARISDSVCRMSAYLVSTAKAKQTNTNWTAR
jgi:hypothetical protein